MSILKNAQTNFKYFLIKMHLFSILQFPILSSKIQGEEQNSFQNTLGECIQVELTNSVEETRDLLCKVLDGKVSVAESLAAIVHSEDALCETEYTSSETIPADNLGVWIDPIGKRSAFLLSMK